jgi:hypothetical protein
MKRTFTLACLLLGAAVAAPDSLDADLAELCR